VPSIEESGIGIILLDIEGTTTPIDFVHRILFGYARDNLATFLQKSSSEPEVHACVTGLMAQHMINQQEGQRPPEWQAGPHALDIDSVARYALWLMERDSKNGPLKALQGLIWQGGYRSGALRGEVFPDVPQAFDRWRRQGKEIAIYSSGSALAQEMLFRTTEFGDLATHIKSFFDTRVGSKTSAESYRTIASVAGYAENQFLFFSDTIEELDAASSAGMQTALVVRSSISKALCLPGRIAIRGFDQLA
jgi:enolase-phosphatase E1